MQVRSPVHYRHVQDAQVLARTYLIVVVGIAMIRSAIQPVVHVFHAIVVRSKAQTLRCVGAIIKTDYTIQTNSWGTWLIVLPYNS
jgi:ribosomal protein L14